MHLQGCWVIFSQKSLLILLEDAQHHSIDDEPAVLPEQGKEALHLVEWDHLREQCHDPILAQDEHLNFLVIEVLVQVGHFFLDQDPDHLAVHVEAWQLAHVHLFQVVVIQQANGQLEGQYFATVEVQTGYDIVEPLQVACTRRVLAESA